ncbi:MAG: hypothetical protein PHI27_03810 [Eubacteriales bacterium]|nr:hypothetical protein [Eubacteriales bacterium]MDD3881360.1 hypothetical protein [Eubacteriales bacterium]MDD4513047.1 hypothetical protein [Eubacteriales bacterium]
MDDISESEICEELLEELPEIQDVGDDFELAYGCIFCKTGSEKTIAYCLRRYFGCADATYLRQIKHKSVNGTKSDVEKTALPGYVFFSAANTGYYTSSGMRIMKDVLKLLCDQRGDWRLSGADMEFAEKALACGGLWGVSKAQVIGGRVHITAGPLKDYEGSIIKIDRRNRNGLIQINFDGRLFKVWLAFDLTEEVKSDENAKERE